MYWRNQPPGRIVSATVNNMSDDLARLLVRDLEALQRELEACPDEDVLWRVVPGITNSIGTLALHCAGNLRHFVGGVLGGSGYVRERDAEFGRRNVPRADLIAEIGRASADVRAVLPRLDAEALERPFPIPVAGVRLATRLFLMHLAVHLGFHLGQAGYLRRVLTGGGTTKAVMSPAELSRERGAGSGE